MSLDIELILQALSKGFEELEAKWETRFSSGGVIHHGQEAASELPFLSPATTSYPAVADVAAAPTVPPEGADATQEVPLASCMLFPAKDFAHCGSVDTECIDSFSLLPDALLGDIVSRLPIKDAVRTAVLSRRWRPIWHVVPLVLFDTHICLAGEDKIPKHVVLSHSDGIAPAAPSAGDGATNISHTSCLKVCLNYNITKDCSFNNLLGRYTTTTPSLSSSVGSNIHDAQKLSEETSAHNQVLVEPLLAIVFGIGPWPPPVQLEMQSGGIQFRPIPWPSFACWNDYCACCQNNKKDRDFVLWIPWKIPWPFFWKYCVYVRWLNLLSHLQTSLSLVISMNRCMMQSLSCGFSLERYSKWLELLINALSVVGFSKDMSDTLFQSHLDTKLRKISSVLFAWNSAALAAVTVITRTHLLLQFYPSRFEFVLQWPLIQPDACHISWVEMDSDDTLLAYFPREGHGVLILYPIQPPNDTWFQRTASAVEAFKVCYMEPFASGCQISDVYFRPRNTASLLKHYGTWSSRSGIYFSETYITDHFQKRNAIFNTTTTDQVQSSTHYYCSHGEPHMQKCDGVFTLNVQQNLGEVTRVLSNLGTFKFCKPCNIDSNEPWQHVPLVAMWCNAFFFSSLSNDTLLDLPLFIQHNATLDSNASDTILQGSLSAIIISDHDYWWPLCASSAIPCDHFNQAEVIYKQMAVTGILILEFYDLMIKDP